MLPTLNLVISDSSCLMDLSLYCNWLIFYSSFSMVSVLLCITPCPSPRQLLHFCVLLSSYQPFSIPVLCLPIHPLEVVQDPGELVLQPEPIPMGVHVVATTEAVLLNSSHCPSIGSF